MLCVFTSLTLFVIFLVPMVPLTMGVDYAKLCYPIARRSCYSLVRPAKLNELGTDATCMVMSFVLL